MKVVSYCVYGTNRMYLQGMTRNLQQIREFLPDWEAWILVSATVPSEYVKTWETLGARIHPTEETGGRLMAQRFLVADDPNVEVMVVRDADSRWGPRDLSCLDDFMQSNYRVFTIRDHPWHLRRIMGGQWGMKQVPGLSLTTAHQAYAVGHNMDIYHSDEEFLVSAVYEPLKDHFVAYTSGCAYPNEAVRSLPPRDTPYDFCGNVFDFDTEGSECVLFNVRGRLPSPVRIGSMPVARDTPGSDSGNQ